jgi:hypothetical protein
MGNRALPQPADIDNRTVLAVVGGFLLFVAAAISGLLLFLHSQAPSAFSLRVERPFPSPELQTSPELDLARLTAAQRAQLSGYAWIDRDHGIARVPIEEAMRLVARRGAHAYDPILAPPVATPAPSGGSP